MISEDQIQRAIDRVIADLLAGGFPIDDDDVQDVQSEVEKTVDDIEHRPMLEPVRTFLCNHPQSARLIHEIITVTAMSELLLREIRALRSPRPRS
jgi:hypothetical protein